MWKKLDTLLTKFEKKGFSFANKAHIYAINTIFIVIGYQGYTFFRDYNRFYMEAREADEDMVVVPQDQEQQQFPLNKNIPDRR